MVTRSQKKKKILSYHHPFPTFYRVTSHLLQVTQANLRGLPSAGTSRCFSELRSWLFSHQSFLVTSFYSGLPFLSDPKASWPNNNRGVEAEVSEAVLSSFLLLPVLGLSLSLVM